MLQSGLHLQTGQPSSPSMKPALQKRSHITSGHPADDAGTSVEGEPDEDEPEEEEEEEEKNKILGP
eukprot:m.228265 g.228265  ORF g.228265 m.228265 type:complete len:66 (-) comp15190_c0_seq1:1312-1509(-)